MTDKLIPTFLTGCVRSRCDVIGSQWMTGAKQLSFSDKNREVAHQLDDNRTAMSLQCATLHTYGYIIDRTPRCLNSDWSKALEMAKI